MTRKVVVTCDRCLKQVEGLIDDVATSGFYDVRPGSAWMKYAEEGEEYICESCMRKDEQFQRDYPQTKGKAP